MHVSTDTCIVVDLLIQISMSIRRSYDDDDDDDVRKYLKASAS